MPVKPAKAYLQIGDIHSPDPAVVPSGLEEHLLEKHKSKPTICKWLMPKKRPGAPWTSRDLMGWTEKTNTQAVWSCYAQMFRATWWLWHSKFLNVSPFSRDGKRPAWPRCLSQHSNKRGMRSVPQTQVNYLVWNPSAFLMKIFTSIISDGNRLQEWNPDTAEVNGESPTDFREARTLPVTHIPTNFHWVDFTFTSKLNHLLFQDCASGSVKQQIF